MDSSATHQVAKDVLARLERARELHSRLNDSIESLPSFDIGHEIAYDEATGCTEVRLVIPPMPHEWGFLASEALHHMRSSLDNVLYGAIHSSAPDPSLIKRPQFPLFNEETTFDNNARKQFLAGASENLVKVVRAHQPFSFQGTLDDSLGALGKLNVADKHHALTVTGTAIKHQIKASGVQFRFDAPHGEVTFGLHRTELGSIGNAHALFSVMTAPPHAKAIFGEIEFLEKDIRFEVVLSALPSFSVDDLEPAIDDVETVCRAMFPFLK